MPLRLALRIAWRQRTTVWVLAVLLATSFAFGFAVFQTINGLLLAPLPFDASERIAVVSYPFEVARRLTSTQVTIERQRFDAAGLSESVAFSQSGPFAEAAALEGIVAQAVSKDFFRVMGIQPLRGRVLASDDLEVHPLRCVIGEDLWRSRFGSSDVIGHEIVIGGGRAVVVGIVGRRTRFPSGASIWTLAPENHDAMPGYVRLNQGVSLAQLQAFLPRFNVAGIEDVARPRSAQGIAILACGAAAFLLATWIQVVALQVTLASSVGADAQVRRWLGASTWDLARLYLSEAGLLVGGAALLSVPMVPAAFSWIQRVLPAELTRGRAIVPDPALGAIVALLTLAVITASVVVPRLAMSSSVHRSSPGRSASQGLLPRRLRAGLIVLQVSGTLSVFCLALAATSAVRRLEASPIGFDVAGVYVFYIGVPASRSDGGNGRSEAIRSTLAELEQIKGVSAAAASSVTPLAPGGLRGTLRVLDRPSVAPFSVRSGIVTRDYFRTLHLEWVRGGADAVTPGVVVISAALAGSLGGSDAIVGHEIMVSALRGRVVGVVTDVQSEPGLQPEPQAYFVNDTGVTNVIVRSVPEAVAAVQRVLLVRFSNTRQLPSPAQQLSLTLAPYQGRRSVLGYAALMSILLGIAGVIASTDATVRELHRDIAIRMALGATDRSLYALLLTWALKPLAAGLAAGAITGWVLLTALSQLLVGLDGDVTPFLVMSVVVLGLTAILAVAWPLRTIRRINVPRSLQGE
jgi:hypothetical protein